MNNSHFFFMHCLVYFWGRNSKTYTDISYYIFFEKYVYVPTLLHHTRAIPVLYGSVAPNSWSLYTL